MIKQLIPKESKNGGKKTKNRTNRKQIVNDRFKLSHE